jgi:hypothetical protein
MASNEYHDTTSRGIAEGRCRCKTKVGTRCGIGLVSASEVNDMTIEPGNRVTVRSATGEKLGRRAVSTIEPGHDFAVVWVCREEEWEAAKAEDRDPEATPWPAEDVELQEAVTA